MWNTPNGTVCFPTGAMASLLAYTIRDFAEAICYDPKGGRNFDDNQFQLLELLMIARCLLLEGSSFSDITEEECRDMVGLLFDHMRTKVVQEIQSPEKPGTVFWQTMLLEAYKELAEHDKECEYYGDGDLEDIGCDTVLDYLKSWFCAESEQEGYREDYVSDSFYYLPQRQCRYDNDTDDDTINDFMDFSSRLHVPPTNQDSEEESDEAQETFRRMQRSAAKEYEANLREIFELCDNFIA